MRNGMVRSILAKEKARGLISGLKSISCKKEINASVDCNLLFLVPPCSMKVQDLGYIHPAFGTTPAMDLLVWLAASDILAHTK